MQDFAGQDFTVQNLINHASKFTVHNFIVHDLDLIVQDFNAYILIAGDLIFTVQRVMTVFLQPVRIVCFDGFVPFRNAFLRMRIIAWHAVVCSLLLRFYVHHVLQLFRGSNEYNVKYAADRNHARIVNGGAIIICMSIEAPFDMI